ncbi:MAG: RNA-binding protein [Ruminococcaceae bacterium]|nr:RNA-binding protein [Oscillospiraceae bacterium]
MTVNIAPASLVKVTAGRDKDKYFAVISIIDNNYLYICDGRRRKVSTPKKKKIKHLENLNYSLNLIKEKLERGNEISNSDIKKSIREGLIHLKILYEE